MARAWIEDGWRTTDKKPSPQDGVGSRWRVYWWEDCAADAIGRTKRRRSKRFKRKPEAEQFAAKLDNDLRAGTYRPPEHAEILLTEIATEWLNTRLDIKPGTARQYERTLNAYVLPQWSTRRIGTITKPQVAEWVSALSTGIAPAAYKVRGVIPPAYEVKERMNGPLSPATVDQIHTVLSAVLGWAVETDRITRNPAAGVRLPRVTPQEHVYLSHKQVEALATAAHGVSGNETDRVLVHFLAYTGLRINEALALRTSSLNLLTSRAQVVETWTLDRAGKKVLGPPKNHEKRTVPMPRFLTQELMELTTGNPRESFVFRSSQGGALNDHNWRSRVFNLAVNDADLEAASLTPHKLRHTAASAAIAAGADVKVVQQMLGHKDATETLNTYGHLWPDRLDEVSTALELARNAALEQSAPFTHVSIMSPAAS
ncbi:integrase [Arthrobacter sp. PL16]|uniref:tyrosine-type recombinase/integrase n=1 Tax=Arthrobacter sp. PL16 TaxID=3071720 RepID=UPI002E0C86F5|nr:integrase [Arthrobacter sp. PL16]